MSISLRWLVVRFGRHVEEVESAGDGMNYPAWLICLVSLFCEITRHSCSELRFNLLRLVACADVLLDSRATVYSRLEIAS